MAENDWVDVSVKQDGGIMKKILVEGTGPCPVPGTKVYVHYVGTLTEGGKKFDSSRDRGDKFTFELGQGRVIKGWDQGVATMKEGEKCILRCRSDYAYGDRGSPPNIPGGASLDFEVELFENWDECMSGADYKMIDMGNQWGKPKEEGKIVFDFQITDKTMEEKLWMFQGATHVMDEENKEWPEWFEKVLYECPENSKSLWRMNPEENPPSEVWGCASDEPYYFTITVRELENPKELWSMKTPEEKLEEAKKRKEKGNQYFKAKNFAKALKNYNAAWEAIKAFSEGGDGTTSDEEDVGEELQGPTLTLFLGINSNLAMAALKTDDNSLAIDCATRVLTKDPNHMKALARRAQAYMNMNRYNEARQDLSTALKADPNNAYCKQLEKIIIARVKKEEKRQKRMAKKMFGGSSKKPSVVEEEVTAKEEPKAEVKAAAGEQKTDELADFYQKTESSI